MAQTHETVSVRMYRWILGDCFLLTHTRKTTKKTQTYRALIDCGVLQRMGSEEKKPSTTKGLKQIADVVKDLTAMKHLDLVIATHEHYDHLSGFLLHNAAFDGVTIGEVWLAWTENPNDKLANDIRENGRKALTALKSIAKVERNALTSDADAERVQAIADLMQFYDDAYDTWSGMGLDAKAPRPPYVPGAPPRSCADVIAWLKHKAGEANVKYLEPGQIVAFGLDKALKANVLGPPRTPERLLQLNPTEGPTKEVYLAKRDDVRSLETVMRFRGMLPARAEDEPPPPPPGPVDTPFSERFHRRPEAVEKCDIAALYEYEPDKERRIDGEWLGTAEALALKIDSDVNNTSLALAVEVPGRHVLLFPADAQVGNWLSWKDQRYPAKPAKPDTPTESINDILGRVVLYKVGHHGSHNATARAEGLELMTSPHLVAMIPVVEATAQEQKTKHNNTGWAMPYAELNTRLKEKTRQRIVQGDSDPVVEKARFKDSIFEVEHEKADDKQSLWVELTLSVPDSSPGSAKAQTTAANTPIG